MKLGLVQPGFGVGIARALTDFLDAREDVLAAYLFGSAATDGPVVNDIDILLLFPRGEENEVLSRLSDIDVPVAEHLGLSTDRLDLIPFDLRLVEPRVLYEALTTGILLKCIDEEALTDAIESLSRYFLENEAILHRRKMLSLEMTV